MGWGWFPLFPAALNPATTGQRTNPVAPRSASASPRDASMKFPTKKWRKARFTNLFFLKKISPLLSKLNAAFSLWSSALGFFRRLFLLPPARPSPPRSRERKRKNKMDGLARSAWLPSEEKRLFGFFFFSGCIYRRFSPGGGRAKEAQNAAAAADGAEEEEFNEVLLATFWAFFLKAENSLFFFSQH